MKDEVDLVNVLVGGVGRDSLEQRRHGVFIHAIGLILKGLVPLVVDVAISAIEIAAAGDFQDVRGDWHTSWLGHVTSDGARISRRSIVT